LKNQLKKGNLFDIYRYTNDENQDVIVFSDEIKSKLFDLSNDEKIYDKLVSSFAPSIFENEDVKKGVLC
jgi:DNA replication licensing factor MCM4